MNDAQLSSRAPLFESKEKRDYGKDVDERVSNHYKAMRKNQSLDVARSLRHFYGTPIKKISIWAAFGLLNAFRDVSDPDLSLPNLHHLYQSALYARDHGFPKWMVITALIHDLGKIIYVRGQDNFGTTMTNQWAITGDTWVLGCALPPSLVFPEYNVYSPHFDASGYGIYKPHCGIRTLEFTYSHDVYLADLLRHPLNAPLHRLPPTAIDIIYLHSFYPFFDQDAYTHFMAPGDEDLKTLLQYFNQCDLYSKTNEVKVTLALLKETFGDLVKEYFPSEEIWI